MNKHSNNTLHFYQADKLHCTLKGAKSHTLLQWQEQSLAESVREDETSGTTLLATDTLGSVTDAQLPGDRQSFSYCAFGHDPFDPHGGTAIGFTGELRHSQISSYLLGNGYRAYHPVLMRFGSPDSFSPFGEGGLNGYAYCSGDPINYYDPSGHAPVRRLSKSTGIPIQKKQPPLSKGAPGKPHGPPRQQQPASSKPVPTQWQFTGEKKPGFTLNDEYGASAQKKLAKANGSRAHEKTPSWPDIATAEGWDIKSIPSLSRGLTAYFEQSRSGASRISSASKRQAYIGYVIRRNFLQDRGKVDTYLSTFDSQFRANWVRKMTPI